MKAVIAFIMAIVITVVALDLYLGPNDLRSCNVTPGTELPCEKADAIIAISGGDTYARTEEAVNLYKNGWADHLIFSGAAADKSGPSNASAMRTIALQLGVPADVIDIEEISETTRQNAEQSQSVFERQGTARIILVTSGYHQRRASLEFSRQSEGSLTIINHPVASDEQWSGTWWLTSRGWYLAISEVGKIIASYLGESR